MSLGLLPVEIFRLIVAELTEADKQCLRLGCRGFMALIDPQPRVDTRDEYFDPGGDFGLEFIRNGLFSQRILFIRRLLYDDVLYRKSESDICIKCLQVLPLSEFSLPMLCGGTSGTHRWPRAGGRLCDDCSMGLIRLHMEWGTRQVVRGKSLYRCGDCGDHRLSESEAYLHHPNSDPDTRLCAPCHLQLCWNLDRECSGWPPGFREHYKNMTCQGHCGVCEKCEFVLSELDIYINPAPENLHNDSLKSYEDVDDKNGEDDN